MIVLKSELKIHAWGGLGSQLFAVALLKDIEKAHPGRKIVIFLHTGGITRRVPEVVDLFPEISFNYKDDYSVSRIGSASSTKNPRILLATYLKRLLTSVRLLQTCNDDSSFKRISFWTRSIRGHYSYRTITKEFLEMLNDRLCKVSPNNEINYGVCSIHYRLGDLLLLENKHPLAPKTVLQEFERLSNIFNFSQVEIFSDSSTLAMELLDPFGLHEMTTPDADTVSVMVRASQSQYFLGTSSKVSFWIAAIRSKVFDKQSSIPSQNIREISGLLNKDFRLVNFYGA
jgi:hypothetical protein